MGLDFRGTKLSELYIFTTVVTLFLQLLGSVISMSHIYMIHLY